MKNDILEKINKHLLSGISREADVVYLLVQIRKVLDESRDKYPTLYLDCDWVLHTAIDRNKSREKILAKIGRAVAALENPDGPDHASALKDINDAISQVDLYQQMKSFLKENSLPLDILNGDNWKNFINFLMAVLQDVPLIASDNPLNLVSQFSYAEALDVSHSFRVRILLPDQRVYHSPITTLKTNWAVGVDVDVVRPSGAAHESDIDPGKSGIGSK